MSRRVSPAPAPLPPLNAAFGAANAACTDLRGLAALLWDMQVAMGEEDSRGPALGLIGHVLEETAERLADAADHISDELRRREAPPTTPERTGRR